MAPIPPQKRTHAASQSPNTAPAHNPFKPTSTSESDATTHQPTTITFDPTTISLPPKSSKKRKPTTKPHTLHTHTFRTPPHTTLRLRLTTTSPITLDPLTAIPLLTQPLTAYMGTTGAAIPLDIVKCEGRDVWVRIRRGDERGVRAGVGGWAGRWQGEGVGWRVLDDGEEGVWG